MNRRCPDCDSIRIFKKGMLWCTWCKVWDRQD